MVFAEILQKLLLARTTFHLGRTHHPQHSSFNPVGKSHDCLSGCWGEQTSTCGTELSRKTCEECMPNLTVNETDSISCLKPFDVDVQ